MSHVTTVEGAIEIAETIKKRSEEHFLRDGYVAPITFCFLRKDPETGVSRRSDPVGVILMPDSLRNPDEKDVYAETLHALMKECDGIAVIFVMEAWTADGEDALRWRESHDSFKDYPDRKERVVLTMEHEDIAGGITWWAEILRPEGQTARLGPWEKQMMDSSSEGRFFGFFNEPVEA